MGSSNVVCRDAILSMALICSAPCESTAALALQSRVPASDSGAARRHQPLSACASLTCPQNYHKVRHVLPGITCGVLLCSAAQRLPRHERNRKSRRRRVLLNCKSEAEGITPKAEDA